MPEISTWFEKTPVGVECLDDQHCTHCEPNGNCDVCDTIDGRYIECVNEYASTCDRCAKLTHHDHLTIDLATELGYCDDCIPLLPKEIRNNLEGE